MAVPAPDVIKILGKEATYDEMRILGAFQYMYRHGFCFLMIYQLSCESSQKVWLNLESFLIDICYCYIFHLNPCWQILFCFHPTCIGPHPIEVRDPIHHLFLWLSIIHY